MSQAYNFTSQSFYVWNYNVLGYVSLQRHIQVAKNTPVNCQIRNEGDVNLFEMAVEVDVNGRRATTVSMQA